MQQALHGGWQVLMDELDTERVTYCEGDREVTRITSDAVRQP